MTDQAHMQAPVAATPRAPLIVASGSSWALNASATRLGVPAASMPLVGLFFAWRDYSCVCVCALRDGAHRQVLLANSRLAQPAFQQIRIAVYSQGFHPLAVAGASSEQNLFQP